MRLAHTGVDLFFVLSGYVFAPYLAKKPLHLAGFWTRRFFRIYPLYLLALGIYVLQKHVQGQPLLYLAEHLGFLYLQSREMAFYYNPPFWSLPSEVSFYLILPLIAALFARCNNQHTLRLWWTSIILLALGLRGYLGYHADFKSENLAFLLVHHLPGVAIEFLIGAIAWRTVNKKPGLAGESPNRALRAVAWIVIGASAWAWLAWHFGRLGDEGIRNSWLNGQVGAIAALCYGIILVGLLSLCTVCSDRYKKRSIHPQQQRLPLLNTLFKCLGVVCLEAGRLSYGVYLFHMAALQMAKSISLQQPDLFAGQTVWFAVALTLIFAWLANRLWEQPWRNLGRRLAHRLE